MTDSHDEDLRRRLRGVRVFGPDLPGFDAAAAPDDPQELFVDWITGAIEAGVAGPQTMTLSTVDEQGLPNARILILKGIRAGRWQFATTSSSVKGRELAAHPAAALTFHWPQLARQVRLRGTVHHAGAAASAADFRARPEGSRAESYIGRQSQVLDDEAQLDAALEDALARVQEDPELVPPAWALYELAPEEIEFWQGEVHRRHVRLRYRRDGGAWARERLWP